MVALSKVLQLDQECFNSIRALILGNATMDFGCLTSLCNEREWIYEFFLTTVPMFFLLFFDSAVVEIDKVPCDELVRVRSCKFPLLIVFSQPGLPNKNRSVLTFDCHLHVVDLNLRESRFLPVRSGLRISIVENHNVRFCLWH